MEDKIAARKSECQKLFTQKPELSKVFEITEFGKLKQNEGEEST